MPWYKFAVPGSGWNIPSGGVPSPQTPYLVRWLDYRGNVVRQQYAAAGQTFSNPAAPVFAGLTFSSWCGSSALVTENRDIIGVWTPTDSKAHVFIEASSLAGLTPTIKVNKSDTSTLLIEWGDGTTSTSTASGNVTIVKDEPYVAGSYEIKKSISVGTGTFTGGYGSNGNPMVAGVAVTEVWFRGSTAAISDYALNGTAFRTMKYVTGMSGVLTIGANAFQSCYALISVSMPSATSIGATAFHSCYALVVFMPSATSIGSAAFQFCYSSLVSASMPSATSIGTNAFQYCRLLQSATLGPNCTLIDTLAFDSVRNLISLRVEATSPPTLASVATLADYDPRMLIYVPTASVEAYKAATNWSSLAARIVGY